MNLCGNCKHWGNEEDEQYEYRTCQAVTHKDRRIVESSLERERNEDEIEHAERLKERTETLENRKAVVIDGSDYFAALKSREDFGCILFEAK